MRESGFSVQVLGPIGDGFMEMNALDIVRFLHVFAV